jgi:hypothetical protein
VEQPPDLGQVAGDEPRPAGPGLREVHHDPDVLVVVGVHRDVELVVDERRVHDAQHAGHGQRREAREALPLDRRVDAPGPSGVADVEDLLRRALLPPPVVGPRAHAGEVRLPVDLVLDAVDPAATAFDVGEVPGRHGLPQPPQRGAVQVLRVALVVAVLAGEAPVADAVLHAAAQDEVVLDQFLGQLGVDGVRLLAGERDVDPHHAEALLDRVGDDRQLAADRGVGAVGDDGAEPAVGQVEGPSVVGAADGAGELLVPHRQRDAPVRAPVEQRVRPAAVADEDELLARDRHGPRRTGDAARPLGRVPVPAEAGGGRVVVRPLRPVLAAGEAGVLGGTPRRRWAGLARLRRCSGHAGPPEAGRPTPQPDQRAVQWAMIASRSPARARWSVTRRSERSLGRVRARKPAAAPRR